MHDLIRSASIPINCTPQSSRPLISLFRWAPMGNFGLFREHASMQLVQQKLGCNYFFLLSLSPALSSLSLTADADQSWGPRKRRGLTLMHATPVAASQVEDEASPLLTCGYGSTVYKNLQSSTLSLVCRQSWGSFLGLGFLSIEVPETLLRKKGMILVRLSP